MFFNHPFNRPSTTDGRRIVLPALAAPILMLLCLTSTASARYRPVYDAADRYRDAVKDFERLVFRADDMGRVERTLADSLEDQTSRVKSEARDLDRPDRLSRELEAASRLHTQVEQLILGDPRRPSLAVLIPAWQNVEIAFDQLIQIIQGPVGGGFAPAPFGPITPPVTSYRAPVAPYYPPAPQSYFPPAPVAPVPIAPAPAIPPAYRDRDCDTRRSFTPSYQPAPYRRAPIGRFGTGAYLQRL